jgi:site-specific DNA-cytosine methylase
MRCLWQCDVDPFAQRVLAGHWPDLLLLRDIRGVDPTDLPRVDVICGGFPCQPVSRTGLRLAQADERWLWPEFARFIRELRPGYVLVENVPGLLDSEAWAVCSATWPRSGSMRSGTVYRLEPSVPVSPRDRVWLVAYPAGEHGPAPRVLEPGAIRRASTQPRGLPRDLVAEGRVRADLRGRCRTRRSCAGSWGSPIPEISWLDAVLSEMRSSEVPVRHVYPRMKRSSGYAALTRRPNRR